MRQPPTLPSSVTLQRFFRERRPCSIAEAADIVGYSETWVRKRAEIDGIDLAAGVVPWEDVMLWFLRAWPLPLVEDAVPPETIAHLPALLRTTTVTWRLPRYLVHALDRQTALESARSNDRHALTVEQYVAEQLHLVIDDDTVAAMNDDRGFMEAWLFPDA
ncbi:MAG TPA: hypothetical protein VG323_10425 [Thermoanaerobaculia bacterium]|nr:hypothetical protein [Thermoanaerobaculia bacterium]